MGCDPPFFTIDKEKWESALNFCYTYMISLSKHMYKSYSPPNNNDNNNNNNRPWSTAADKKKGVACRCEFMLVLIDTMHLSSVFRRRLIVAETLCDFPLVLLKYVLSFSVLRLYKRFAYALPHIAVPIFLLLCTCVASMYVLNTLNCRR